MSLWLIPGIFFFIIVIVLICIASKGIPIGTIIIFGLIYFQAIIVYLVLADKFSLEGILGMENIVYELFVNPLTYFDSALQLNGGVAMLELFLFGIILLYICYKMIYNNLKHTIQKKYAFLFGLLTFGILFVIIFGGGMPTMWFFVYIFLLDNLIFIVITLVLVVFILFILKGTNWIKWHRKPMPPATSSLTITDLGRVIQQELHRIDQLMLDKQSRNQNK